MEVLHTLAEVGYEQVVHCVDSSCGYQGMIAIHSTARGPAVGGTRMWRYATEADALIDALRLSRGMTYKNAAAGLPLGGGKSVILESSRPYDREAVMRAHGRFVERLGGRYVAAEDVGTTPADMAVVRTETRHVAGLEELSGNPAPWTARGVLRAMQASAQFCWGSPDLAGRRVALQGCGNVGRQLAIELKRLGAELVVSDIDAARAAGLAESVGARVVLPGGIYQQEADIFAPCALGGVLSEETIPLLRTKIVAGAANNQLLCPEDGDALHARGIVYAPDYVANAGGVINGCREIVGWDPERSSREIDAIYDRLLEVFRLATTEGIAFSRAANRYAEARARL